jgi:hypothetical protein
MHPEQCFCDECLCDTVLFADNNYECAVEFFRCDTAGRIGLTIEDWRTGNTLDFFFDKAALVAALSR